MRVLMKFSLALLSVLLMFSCSKDDMSILVQADDQPGQTEIRKKPAGAGNNLSFPVIWAENIPKTLRGTQGTVQTGGDFWWWWGIEGVDPNTTVIYSCLGDPDYPDEPTCLVEPEVPELNEELVKVYPQKDPLNEWQAWNGGWNGPVNIDQIDWGDNLESVDWYLKSKVRTEVVLYKSNPGTPWLEYEMRHLDGWGISELHGLATDVETGNPILGPGDVATVYSHCARFTMQKLDVATLDDPIDREALAALTWGGPELGWEGVAVAPPFFNKPVWAAGDGPGYYSAEINIKGKIIYGYTWDVKQANEGAGYYRLTFSFDPTAGPDGSGPALNTFITNGTTIYMPVEETVASEEEGGGGLAVLRVDENLTYMDIYISGSNSGGGGGGNNPGGGGGPGNGGGGGNGPGGGGH